MGCESRGVKCSAAKVRWSTVREVGQQHGTSRTLHSSASAQQEGQGESIWGARTCPVSGSLAVQRMAWQMPLMERDP